MSHSCCLEPMSHAKSSQTQPDLRILSSTAPCATKIAMASLVLPYTVEHYNSLPELQVAKFQFESVRASDILFTDIGRVFVKHHVENMLGVVLLHNHFLLNPHEMLVSVNSAAVPWDTRSSTKELGAVNASSWRFTENGIAPYEFTHMAPEIPLDCQPMQSFFQELGAILAKWNLANILGICSLNEMLIDRPATMEFTSGRANITLPFDIAENDGNNVDAMWQFSSDQLGSSPHTGPTGKGKSTAYGACNSFQANRLTLSPKGR